MAITVTSCKYYDEFTGTGGGGTDYLLGYPGDKITAIIDFYVKVSSENIAVITSETSSNNTIRRTDNGSFLKDGFRIGNSISTTGMGTDSGNWVISNVTEKVITVSTSLATKHTFLSAYIYRTNLVTASDFYYNLIENEAPDSFVSLVDQETQQRYTVSSITATGTTGTYSIASNSKAWAVDEDGCGVTILGTGISNYKQSFTITQVFIITPVSLYTQLENLESGIPPATDYFADRKCLKHLFRIDMKIEKTDPEIVDTVTLSRKGNTGWFGEFLNGEAATYSVAAPTYTYGAETVTEIQYDDTTPTVASISLTSTNFTFTTGATAVVHVIYLDSDSANFTNTTNKYCNVFAYDRVSLTCGAAAQNGINFGTTYGQIYTATSTFVNTATITISCSFRLATSLETRISGRDTDNRNYLIFVTIQNPSVTTTKGTDRNALIIDVNSYDKSLDDSSLFTINPNVKFYDASNQLKGSQVNGYGGDIVRAVVPFEVVNSGSQLLTSIGYRIDAVYTGATGTFTLEEWSADTSDYCLDDGVQEIAISQTKGYRLPSSSLLNKVTVSRNTALDTATKAGYTLSYPFQLRYETWRELDGADCDFGDATQDWSIIAAKSGWSIKGYVTASVYDPATDHTTDFEQSCIINVTSAGATGATGTWCVITTTDETNVDQNGDISEVENTIVIANFYGNFSSLPTGTTGYYGVLFLDQQTIGGVNWVYPFSSYEDLRQADGGSPWTGVTGSTGTASVTIVNSTHIQVKGMLLFEKLDPAITNYNLRAKLDYLK